MANVKRYLRTTKHLLAITALVAIPVAILGLAPALGAATLMAIMEDGIVADAISTFHKRVVQLTIGVRQEEKRTERELSHVPLDEME